MTQEHPQAAILRAIAEGKTIQLEKSNLGDWTDCGEDAVLENIRNNGFTFRIKPETITINGIECPKNVVARGEVYKVQVSAPSQRRLRIYCFDTAEDARQVFDALVLPFKEAV